MDLQIEWARPGFSFRVFVLLMCLLWAALAACQSEEKPQIKGVKL